MTTYQRLLKEYRAAVVEYEANPYIARTFPSWIDTILEPLGRKLAQKYSVNTPYISRVLGPFGLGARTSIHFHRKDTFDRFQKYERQASRPEWLRLNNAKLYGVHFITFECYGQGNKRRLAVVDYTVKMNSFPLGTIGEMNGFNHPTVIIPTNANLKWFMSWITNQEA